MRPACKDRVRSVAMHARVRVVMNASVSVVANARTSDNDIYVRATTDFESAAPST